MDYKILQIFKMFLVRDCGFSKRDAKVEVEFFKILEKPMVDVVLRDYIVMKRKGTKHQLNRKERMEIFLSFENAVNHATF